jgi:hypothetical protein
MDGGRGAAPALRAATHRGWTSGVSSIARQRSWSRIAPWPATCWPQALLERVSYSYDIVRLSESAAALSSVAFCMMITVRS